MALYMKIELTNNMTDIPPDDKMMLLDKICVETNFRRISEGEYELKEDVDSIGTFMILIKKN